MDPFNAVNSHRVGEWEDFFFLLLAVFLVGLVLAGAVLCIATGHWLALVLLAVNPFTLACLYGLVRLARQGWEW